MGYYATLDFSSVKIPLSAEKDALEAVYRLDKAAHHLKLGGSYGGERDGVKWFSWMPEDLRTLTTLEDLLQTLGFRTHESDGAIHVDGYDSKVGQEELFFFALAPFIEPNHSKDFLAMANEPASMEWTGEDGSKWRWTFQDGEMIVWEASINWTGPFTARYDWQAEVRGTATA
jgi:hypothetical protein